MTYYQTTAKEFNSSNISCTEPKNNKKKKLQAYLLYDYGANKTKPLYIETPEALICPFGLSLYKPEKGEPSYSLPMIMKSSLDSENPVVEQFFNELRALDEFMIAYGVKYSKQIFNKEYSREVVEANYSGLVKESVNKVTGEKYPPKVSPKISKVWDDKSMVDSPPQIEVYTTSNKDNHPKTWEQLAELLPKGVSATGILQIRPWFVSGKFGLVPTLLKVKLLPLEKNEPPRGYSFSRPPVLPETSAAPASSHEETHCENEQHEQHESSSSDKPSEHVDDSDEELDEELEEVEEVEEVEES
jgi:hypothetical protein